MSYDYDALVTQIFQARRDAHEAANPITATSATTATNEDSDKKELEKGEGHDNDIPPLDATSATTASNSKNKIKKKCVHVHFSPMVEQEAVSSHLEKAVGFFQQLSSHCPMTPLLWIHYAESNAQLLQLQHNMTTTTITTINDNNESDRNRIAQQQEQKQHVKAVCQQQRLSIIQHALQQFPGSALLHFYHCHCVGIDLHDDSENDNNTNNNGSGLDGDNKESEETVSMEVEEPTTDSSKLKDTEEKQKQLEQQMQALEMALANIGQGSHGHSGSSSSSVLLLSNKIAQLYNRFAWLNLKKQQLTVRTGNNNNSDATALEATESAANVFVRRASCPVDNDTLSTDVQAFLTNVANKEENPNNSKNDDDTENTVTFSEASLKRRIEQARLWAARELGQLAHLENDVQVAIQQQGIEEVPHPMDWQTIVQPMLGDKVIHHNYGMGAGNFETANAFVHYAQATFHLQQNYEKKQRRRKAEKDHDEGGDDDDEDTDASFRPNLEELSLLIFERGVAECPTIETIWKAYILHISHRIRYFHKKQPTPTPQHVHSLSLGFYVSRLESVSQRAVRNCPYSVILVQERLRAHFLQSQVDPAIVFDPDFMTECIQSALDTKLLVPLSSPPGLFWNLWQTALRIITRRILHVLTAVPANTDHPARSFDDTEEVVEEHQNKKKKKMGKDQANSESLQLSETAKQEVDDLVDDLDDLYEDVEGRMKKAFPSWSQGRALLSTDRALVYSWLIIPLRRTREGDGSDGEVNDANENSSDDPGLLAWQKAARTHQPPHPDTYLGYIRCFQQQLMRSSKKSPIVVAKHIRQVRYLFQKAVYSVGIPKKAPPAIQTVPSQRDLHVSFAELCHAWLEFEALLGSDESMERANQETQKKWQKLSPVDVLKQPRHQQKHLQQKASTENATTGSAKRGFNVPAETERPAKKPRGQSENVASNEPSPLGKNEGGPFENNDLQGATDTSMQDAEEPKPTDAKNAPTVLPEKVVHKVRIGNLEYPAHPYTVRVSNLSMETEDMDLVDLLRPKCGTIVHARIIREKEGSHHPHHGANAPPKPKSKGWALVQFEERDAVDKALELDDIIGLHEKVLKIDRSHQPAAILVPPGMHRIKPKGEGKHSKRNQKKREEKPTGQSGKNEEKSPSNSDGKPDEKATVAPANDKPSSKISSNVSVLSFQPRGVARNAQRKQRLALGKETNEKK